MFSLLQLHCISVESNVLRLTDKNFDSTIEKLPLAIVMCNKPGISFCDDIVPSFVDSAKECEGKAPFVILDCNSNEKTRQKYGFFAYPSFYIFRYGKLRCEYRGMRDMPSFTKYITRISGPNYTVLEDGRSVRDFLDTEVTSVVLAAEDADPELLATFNTVAGKLTDVISFAAVVDPDAIDLLNLDETPALQLTRLQDRTTLTYPLTKVFTENTMLQWIIDNSSPRYFMRDSVILRDLGRDGRYTIMAFVDTTRKKNLDQMHNIMDKVVTEFGENFTYVYCDIYDMGNIVLSLGFQGTHDPCFAILRLTGGEVSEKHILPDKYDATPRRMLSFVRKFYNQTLHKEVKSEPIPENNNGPFKKIVALNMLNITTDPTKDVVVLCNKEDNEEKIESMKLLGTVAKEFQRQKVKTVEFYHMNLTLNDLPGLTVPQMNETSFIIFWPATENKQPFLMHTKTDARTLCSYIIKNRKSKFRFRIPRKFSVYDPNQEL